MLFGSQIARKIQKKITKTSSVCLRVSVCTWCLIPNLFILVYIEWKLELQTVIERSTVIEKSTTFHDGLKSLTIHFLLKGLKKNYSLMSPFCFFIAIHITPKLKSLQFLVTTPTPTLSALFVLTNAETHLAQYSYSRCVNSITRSGWINSSIQAHSQSNLHFSVKKGQIFNVAHSQLSTQFLWKTHDRY